MPIRKDLKHHYGAQWQREIRPRILARERHRCKFCKKPDRTTVLQVLEDGRMWWTKLFGGPLFDQHGRIVLHDTDFAPKFRFKRVHVVLTIAHLNHDPADNRGENLAALCQWCHLNYDKEHHRETRKIRKDAERPLLRDAG